jgi:hypothetical protein
MRGAPTVVAGQELTTTRESLRVLGDIEERKLIDILALRPTITEIEEAAVWLSGNGDVLAKERRPLTGTAAQIVEILAVDEDESRP